MTSLDELNLSLAAEVADARVRYWAAVNALRADKPLSNEQVRQLREDLRTLDLKTEDLLRDRHWLDWLHEFASRAPAGKQRERVAETKQRVEDAHREVERLETELREAKATAANANIAYTCACDAVEEAERRRREDLRVAEAVANELRTRGYVSALPVPHESAPPRPTRPVRVVERTYVNDRVCERGDVVEVPADLDLTGTPFCEVDAELPRDPQEPERDSRGRPLPPSWSTHGHMGHNHVPMGGDGGNVPLHRPSPQAYGPGRDLKLIDEILTPAPQPFVRPEEAQP